MGRANFEYRVVRIDNATAYLETGKMFDKNYNEPALSPIDMFIEKTRELNKLIGPEPENMQPQLANLITLGYVSAVESYFRNLLRQLIVIDEASRIKCETQTLTYGAAISYDKNMLPESLLENSSFASKENIKKALKNFLGIKNTYPVDVEGVIEQFEKVCQVRHCIVHRFGHLGSNNAIKLGLKEHRELLNKPVRVSFDSLQDIFSICNNTVKVVNNFLFREILVRTAEDENRQWEWDFNKDEERFDGYFKIFRSKLLSKKPYHDDQSEAYRLFKAAMEV
ncbi:MAG: hypothetical protein GY757_56070 [bacterium]|nr:hypothetical protein [bacterium]